jgi:predicted DNA-binding protein
MEESNKVSRFEMRVSPEWLARLDRWARAQGVKRAEAIRRLVEKGLETPGGKRED